MQLKRLLLDTHVFLWWRSNDPRLNDSVRRAIAEAEVVFVSAASAWEAAIKSALGRLELPDSFAAGVADSEFEELPVNFAHAEGVSTLPPHHGDPFDRMLIAQSRAEGLTLVTHDQHLAAYEVGCLWT